MTEPNGLQYMRARYYDPSVARFISEDPIGFAGGDVNLYAYCLNNPIRYIDPDGQFIFAPLLYFAGAKAVAVGTAYLGTKIAQWAANAGGGDISNETINQTFGKIAAINAAEVGAVGLINAGIAAGPALTSVALNPGVIQNAADFVQGVTVPGPPPPSPGGYAGLFVREVADRAGKNF